MADEPEPYWRLLPRLRHDAGLSQAELFRRTDGVSFDTIRALEANPSPTTSGRRTRARYPTSKTLEALAAALGVEPSLFAEYRLAKARDELDERVVGLDRAIDQLERIVSALQQQAVRRGATGAEQRVRRHRGRPASPGEAANHRAG